MFSKHFRSLDNILNKGIWMYVRENRYVAIIPYITLHWLNPVLFLKMVYLIFPTFYEICFMIGMICHLNGCSDISPVWLEGYPQWCRSLKEVYEHYALSVALQVHHFVSLFPIVSLLESSTHMCNLQLLVFASWHYSRLTIVLVLLLNCLWSIWFHWWLELYCGASST